MDLKELVEECAYEEFIDDAAYETAKEGFWGVVGGAVLGNAIGGVIGPNAGALAMVGGALVGNHLQNKKKLKDTEYKELFDLTLKEFDATNIDPMDKDSIGDWLDNNTSMNERTKKLFIEFLEKRYKIRK